MPLVGTINKTNIFIIVVVLLTATYSYLFYQPAQNPEEPSTNETIPVTEEVLIIETHEELKKTSTAPSLNPKFPQCFNHYEYTILSEILNKLYLDSDVCIGPKCSLHINKKQTDAKETTGLIVAYVAICALLISLVAAVLELIKAKKDPVQNKSKPELSRRCSLADLTLLRHSRRESLMRRDSSLSMSVSETPGRVSLKNIGRKMSRPRLRVN